MSTHFLCSHSSSPLPALGSGSGAIRTGPFQEYSFWANAAFSRHSSTRAVEKNVKEINQLRKRKRYLLDTCFVCKRRLTSHADTKWWQLHEWMKGKRDWWSSTRVMDIYFSQRSSLIAFQLWQRPLLGFFPVLFTCATDKAVSSPLDLSFKNHTEAGTHPDSKALLWMPVRCHLSSGKRCQCVLISRQGVKCWLIV